MCSEGLIERYVKTYLLDDNSLDSLKQFRDYANTIDFAEMKGERKGEQRKAEEIARQMLAKSMPVELISEVTGLPLDFINKLYN